MTIITHKLLEENASVGKYMHFAKDINGRYMCPNCNSSYKQKGHLVRHIKYECGVEPQFKCELCSRRFKHKSNLKAHYIFLHKFSVDETVNLQAR
ncbi:hypothetical protein NQ317_012415 [Molorchus minor]|uniref:C2H2-type domain-containing protein n=1 Tax=Molorchus minor TaxID=1323400 RepID=A0ABQ9JE44_9CUCU|nr:hypothetical protein NQ317_012415 [Molorchus minor]